MLDIVAGDESYWQKFDNPEDFEDFAPYYVIVQRASTSLEVDDDLALWPVYADHSDAFIVETEGTGSPETADCPDLALPQTDDPLHRVQCFVAAGEGDEPVAGIRYDSTDKFTFAAPIDNPYYDAPIHWMAG